MKQKLIQEDEHSMNSCEGCVFYESYESSYYICRRARSKECLECKGKIYSFIDDPDDKDVSSTKKSK